LFNPFDRDGRRQDCEDPGRFVAEVLMEQLESADAIVLSPAGDESVRELLMSVNPGAQLLAPQNWLSIIGTSAER
jgi:hypothetical protein